MFLVPSTECGALQPASHVGCKDAALQIFCFLRGKGGALWRGTARESGMEIVRKVKKIGGSLMLPLPPYVLEVLGAVEGTELTLTLENDSLPLPPEGPRNLPIFAQERRERRRFFPRRPSSACLTAWSSRSGAPINGRSRMIAPS